VVNFPQRGIPIRSAFRDRLSIAIKFKTFNGIYRTDEDRAVSYEVCETLKEVKGNAPDYGDDTVIVERETFGNEFRNSNSINYR
jgi:hypothetical protein